MAASHPRQSRAERAAQGRTTRSDRSKADPSRAHRIAVAVYDGLLGFEFGISCEIFGLRRAGLGVQWYDYLPCRINDGSDRETLRTSHGLIVEPPGDVDDLRRADTILVPGWRDVTERPPESFLEILREAHAGGARIVSICTGAFALAHAGLLDGRRATTHWLHAEALQRQFPLVDVTSDALYIHDDRISTSAGSAAGLDLCLSIVRADFGIAVANTVARRMVAPVHRDGGQTQYSELSTATETADFEGVLERLQERLDEALPLADLARDCGFTLRTFQRRFREQTGLSPHQWLSRQRVARARELLETTDDGIERIATLSGLGSAANLRKHLARHLGTTPRAYRAAFRSTG